MRFNNTYEIIQQAAKTFADKTALTFISNIDRYGEAHLLSYQDLFSDINQAARALQELAIRNDQVVSWILPNCPEAYVCFWAAEAIAINNPIMPGLPLEQTMDLIRQADTRLLILPNAEQFPDFSNIFNAVSEQKPNCRVLSIDQFRELMCFHNVEPIACDKIADDPCVIFHTSATTARHKLVAFTHRNRLAMIDMLADRFQFVSTDNILLGLPMFHVGAATLYNANAFLAGAQVIIMGPMGWLNPDLPSYFWHLVEHYQGTHSAALPFVYIQLNHTPIHADIRSLKSLLTGMPFEHDLFVEFTEKLPGVELVHIYGSTESGCIVTTNTDRNPETYRALGLPLEGQAIKIAIFDEHGVYVRDAEPNELGMICVKGDNFGEYLNVAEPAFVDAWFKTKDMGSSDEQGQYHFKCRSQNLLYRNGQAISCFDLDLIFSKHPAIAKVAVLPLASEIEGQVPVAFVALRADAILTEEALQTWFLKQGYDRQWLPTTVYFEDHLPTNGMGKVVKPQLAAMLEAREVEACRV